MPAHVRTVDEPKADRWELERQVWDNGAPARVVERVRIVDLILWPGRRGVRTAPPVWVLRLC